MKFKVGQKVRVVSHPLGSCGKHCFEFVSGMNGYKGKTFTVRDSNESTPEAYLLEDIDRFIFSPCMLEKANNRGKNKRDSHGRFISNTKSNYYDDKFMRLTEKYAKKLDADRKTSVWNLQPTHITVNGINYIREDLI